MSSLKELKAVEARPGKPLYQAVKQAIHDAVDAGIFAPGEQMPSTKELSDQLNVSLVTAHRALQELVNAGVLERSQGKGTFVRQGYAHDKGSLTRCRVGLVFHREASLADFYHSQILEGVRQAAEKQAADLILLRFGDDARQECNGYLLVNPLPQELACISRKSCKRVPAVIVGAQTEVPKLTYIDVDNADLGDKAVEHLFGLGHRRLGYVGGPDHVSNNRDRWNGFSRACTRHGLAAEQFVLKGCGWRMHEQQRTELTSLLLSPQRPTAIFAAGYFFALDVYGAATAAGLRIPQEVSVIGVDDPPSAALLSPSLTTMRQPLVRLGHNAMMELTNRILQEETRQNLENELIKAELMVRHSTAAIS